MRMRMSFLYENVVAAYENDILIRPRMSFSYAGSCVVNIGDSQIECMTFSGV